MNQAFSTRRQLAAYRGIQQREHEAHLLKTYGMLPVKTRFKGKCGCSTAHAFGPGESIVKFRGAWWNTNCVDEIRRQEFMASCRFVLEISVGADRWAAIEWSDDPAQAARWKEYGAEQRVVERIKSAPELHT